MSLSGSWGVELIPANLGREAGFTLDNWAVHHCADPTVAHGPSFLLLTEISAMLHHETDWLSL